MIQLFRKIRQNLLSQNKFSRYLFYAIGEIILVVIGILIAIQINNLNESRKIRTVENGYLKQLVIDLKENEILWKETLDRKQKQLEASHAFLNMRFSKNQDTIMKIMPHFSNLGTWEDININQVTFSEMVSSGNLNIISNDSIKIKLLSLDKLYKAILNRQDVIEAEYRARILEPIMAILNTTNILPQNNKQSKIIKRFLSQNEMSFYADEFKKDMISLLNDKVFMNGVIGIDFNADTQFKEFIQAKEKVNNLITLIEKELEQ
ncbi:hypothetical protein D7030_11965 [Flavobacteriaceae bacterium AU392]|nr:hypothetical protein D1817_12705 [Flavobacteriaceae bacterium]RKM82867.1 hypothetical protein D7030_11965 [Flavobacteriaceae bacterium AU392]